MLFHRPVGIEERFETECETSCVTVFVDTVLNIELAGCDLNDGNAFITLNKINFHCFFLPYVRVMDLLQLRDRNVIPRDAAARSAVTYSAPEIVRAVRGVPSHMQDLRSPDCLLPVIPCE